MEARAIAKHVRMSPRKARRVIDLVRGQNVNNAINTLHFSNKRAASPIEKTIRSAVANMLSQESAAKVDEDEIFVKEARVDEGPRMRRFRAASMGRPMRIKKRTCHITVVVASEDEE
mgnify:CR=1 FL=1